MLGLKLKHVSERGHEHKIMDAGMGTHQDNVRLTKVEVVASHNLSLN